MKGKRLKEILYSHRVLAYNVVSIILILLLWELVAGVVRSKFFPSFNDVIRAFITIAKVGDIEGIKLLDHSIASICRILAGFGLACVTGIPLGLAMGLRRGIYDSTKSITETIRFIPPIAWIPLVIILLSGYWRYIFIIWLGAFFPILINTIAGIKRTNPVFIDVSKIFGADKKSTIRKVVIPSSLPEITAGMRIGLGIGWMCIMAAEMIGGEMIGLGRLIIKYAEFIRVDVVIMGMISIGLIGLFMNEIFLRIEKRLFKWRVEVAV